MGRYYALAQGEPEAVADAIADHYKPLGPADRVPSAPASIAVALADKLDTLIGFWAIDEKPTGSRDPFALRRAALGVIRIVLDNGLTLPLRHLLRFAARPADGSVPNAAPAWEADLLGFFHDRLKVSLRDAGARHDLVDAVVTPDSDDLLQVTRRLDALSALLDSDDGKNLLAGYRRAVNIVSIEEKKDKRSFGGDFMSAVGAEEEALLRPLRQTDAAVHAAVQADDYRAAVTALGQLRAPVDVFFERVLVNDPNPERRSARLNLLAKLRDTMHLVADFSKIAG